MSRFPSSTLIIRVPFFLLFGFNAGTQKEKKGKRVLLGILDVLSRLLQSSDLVITAGIDLNADVPSTTNRTFYPTRFSEFRVLLAQGKDFTRVSVWFVFRRIPLRVPGTQ